MSTSSAVARSAARSARVGIVGTRLVEGIVVVSSTIIGEDVAVDEDAPGSSGLLIVSITALGFLWSSGPSSSSADLRLVCAGARGAAGASNIWADVGAAGASGAANI